MKVRGVDFVMYRVNDIERAVTFYRDVLGLALELQSNEHQWAEFACGNVTLSLFGGSGVTSTGSAARVALAVDDIAVAHAELTARGVPMGGRRKTGASARRSRFSIPTATRSFSTTAPTARSASDHAHTRH